MKIYFHSLGKILSLSICITLSVVLLSFKKPQSKKPVISGFWVTENNGATNAPFVLKTFEKDGRFYNMLFVNGQSVITHKGNYKILDGELYQENITASLPNSAWSGMKGKSYVVTYKLSDDKQHLVLTGFNDSPAGSDTTKWTEYYKRVWEPE